MNIEINDVNYVVRELTVQEFTNDLVADIQAKNIKEASEVAEYMTVPEKAAYMNIVRKDLPKRMEIIEKIDEYLQSFEGIEWVISKCATPAPDVNIQNFEDFLPLYLAGVGAEEPKDAEEKAVEADEVPENPKN